MGRGKACRRMWQRCLAVAAMGDRRGYGGDAVATTGGRKKTVAPALGHSGGAVLRPPVQANAIGTAAAERARAVCEKVWPEDPGVRHPGAPQLLARLEAAPPEAARPMATVI